MGATTGNIQRMSQQIVRFQLLILNEDLDKIHVAEKNDGKFPVYYEALGYFK